jgi:division protein CdvB (Snf7/Vps24/ESCRT-III family)
MKKNFNIFDESILEELKEQHQKVMAQTKEMLEKEDEAYKKLIDSIKLKLKELEQSSLDIDEYIVGLMKIAVESRKQLKEGENI